MASTWGPGDVSNQLSEEGFRALLGALHAPTIQARRTENEHRGHGGFGSVYKGEARLGNQTVPVAIKIFHTKNSAAEAEKFSRNIIRETSVWAKLRHPNVLQFYGVTAEPSARRVWLISPWIDNGDLWKYMRTYRNMDCVYMCRGIMLGVQYLHSINVIHGDIRCNNVLVDRDGQPLLADFGLSRLVEELNPGDPPSTGLYQGSTRWLAPERMKPKQFGLAVSAAHSQASDIYSLGMTMYEIFAQRLPYDTKRNEYDVVSAVLEGTKLDHPGNQAVLRRMNQRIWEFMWETWSTERDRRPSLQHALDTILFDSHVPIDYDKLRGVTRQAHTRQVGRWMEIGIEATKPVYELQQYGNGWYLGRTSREEKGIFHGLVIHLDDMSKTSEENQRASNSAVARTAVPDRASTYRAQAANPQAPVVVPVNYGRTNAGYGPSVISGQPLHQEPSEWPGRRPTTPPSDHDRGGVYGPAGSGPRQASYPPPAQSYTTPVRSAYSYHPGQAEILEQEEEEEEEEDDEEYSPHTEFPPGGQRFANQPTQGQPYYPATNQPLAQAHRDPRRQETVRAFDYGSGQPTAPRGYQAVQGGSYYGQPMPPDPVDLRSQPRGSSTAAASGGPRKPRRTLKQALNSMRGQAQPPPDLPSPPTTDEYPPRHPMQEAQAMYLPQNDQRPPQQPGIQPDQFEYPGGRQVQYAPPGQGQQPVFAAPPRTVRSDPQTYYDAPQRPTVGARRETVPATQYPQAQLRLAGQGGRPQSYGTAPNAPPHPSVAGFSEFPAQPQAPPTSYPQRSQYAAQPQAYPQNDGVDELATGVQNMGLQNTRYGPRPPPGGQDPQYRQQGYR